MTTADHTIHDQVRTLTLQRDGLQAENKRLLRAIADREPPSAAYVRSMRALVSALAAAPVDAAGWARHLLENAIAAQRAYDEDTLREEETATDGK